MIQTYAQGHRVMGSQEIFEKSSAHLSGHCHLFSLAVLQDTLLMNRDGQEGGKEDLASVVLGEIQDQGSIAFRKTSVVSDSAAAARLLAAQLRVPWPLQHGGTVPYSPGAHRHTLTPAGTPAVSFRLICNSFSLHKVLDKKKKKCLYIENFWNSLSGICRIRI